MKSAHLASVDRYCGIPVAMIVLVGVCCCVERTPAEHCPGFFFSRPESHDFGFELESPLVPDLDATSRIEGEPGEVVPFSIFLDLGSGPLGTERGVQGFSLGVWVSGFEFEGATLEGTYSDFRVRGGVVDPDGGFVAFHINDPDEFPNEGREGLTLALIPSLIDPGPYYPIGHRYRIGRIDGRARVEETPRRAFVRYQDGLVGRGQPVQIAATVEGTTICIAREHREIEIGRGAPAEDCEDGIDNDGDGWSDELDPECQEPFDREICDDGVDNDGDRAIDCDDSECHFDAPCPPREVCEDGVDNDGNGDADCDDESCAAHPYCLAREICDDGEDNDSDGDIDCEDRDCGGIDPCPVIERCFDGRDDDDDGLIDCEDPDCVGFVFCGAFESCRDGEDNNGDGLVDCEDPQCSNGPDCVLTEDCEDGIDNDEDGLVDCDDSQCLGVGECPGPERCRDGLDNDRDGLVDCDDPDCGGDRTCIDPEVCDDGIDNDRDGLVDCDDSQCRGRGACPGPEVCDDGIDNDQDGTADCDDLECQARAGCRREVCDDGVDNDIDGLVDCDDPDCFDSGCVREICDNGIDDDGDGLVDCDDPACARRGDCAELESGFAFVLAARNASLEAEPAAPGEGGAAGVHDAELRNVLEVDDDSSRRIEVVTYIVPYPVSQAHGVQGWSLSIAHSSRLLDVVEPPTIEGTDAGDRFAGGFSQTQEAAPTPTGGGAGVRGGDEYEEDAGVVSAVVVSFTQPVTLDPAQAQSVLRTGYAISDLIADGRAMGRVRFRDGLRGSGQPVANVLTIEGRTQHPVRVIPLEIRRSGAGLFVRGDSNSDGKVDLADAVWTLNELMRGGPSSACPRATDANADGVVDLSDPIRVVQYRFLHGPLLPAPFPGCGFADEDFDLPCLALAAALCVTEL